jgi:SAM-dependent methyltransferase
MASSFRDPDGFVMVADGRVLRFLNRSGERILQEFFATAFARQAVAAGQLVASAPVDLNSVSRLLKFPSPLQRSRGASNDIHAVLEHELVPFQSFPYEWAPEMLHAAGVLTLDLAERALPEGFSLKDATPYNILFRSTKPIFVDVSSFEKRDGTDPIWLPYAQFVRTFILPLLATDALGLRLDQIFLTRRDGLEPEDVYRLCGFARRLRPPFLTLVSIPTWLAGKSDPKSEAVYRQRRRVSEEQSTFTLERLFKRLRRQLEQAKPRGRQASSWSEYMASVETFPPNYLSEKEVFLREALGEFKPEKLLDVGCNTGHFSVIAAQQGTSVVAIDQDPLVVAAVWRQAVDQHLNIQTLVVDFARPSPAVGWCNAENPSFLDRARGSFDAVLMLALVHHLMVTERIPLNQVFSLAAEMTTDLLIVEFVGPDDPMFRRLLRGRGQLFEGFSREVFEDGYQEEFSHIRSQQLGQTDRWIYLLRKRK